MQEKRNLTALLIVLNGERVLDACLHALSFCDHILIIDSFSTDSTESIAKKHGATFLQNPFKGYAEQIQFGINYIEKNIPSEWVFFLDCDEICSIELKDSIKDALAQNNNISAYHISRRTWYYDRFLNHGGMYPDKLFRLFKPSAIQITQKNGHPIYTPTAEHANLQGDLLHYSYSSFFNQMEKLNSYAQRGANAMHSNREFEKVGQKKYKKSNIFLAIFHAKWRFIYMYLIKLGFLDGKAGFIFAVHIAFYTFLKYIRINEGSWGKPYLLSLKESATNTTKK